MLLARPCSDSLSQSSKNQPAQAIKDSHFVHAGKFELHALLSARDWWSLDEILILKLTFLKTRADTLEYPRDSKETQAALSFLGALKATPISAPRILPGIGILFSNS